MNFKQFLINIFAYSKFNSHSFILPQNSNNVENLEASKIEYVYSTIKENLNHLKIKYNSLINSDIIFRNFIININNTNFKAFLIFIDGMVDNDSINTNILKPLLLKNSITMSDKNNSNNTNCNF